MFCFYFILFGFAFFYGLFCFAYFFFFSISNNMNIFLGQLYFNHGKIDGVENINGN